MLHGTGELFDYVKCGACGCLQIAPIPRDLGRYYPRDYFSFRSFDHLARGRLRRMIDCKRVQHSLERRNLIGWILNPVARPLDYLTWVQKAGLNTAARVLDVGCGNGKVLLRMRLGGFQQVTGVDPFIRKTIAYPNGVTIHKLTLEAFAGEYRQPFDLIMFHHSLEHMVDPQGALKTAASMLSERGSILVAVPVADSEACERYRENWANLDAPRHLHLFTRNSMAILARNAGLAVTHAESAGLVSQFTASELYRRGIAGNARRSAAEFLSKREIEEFRTMTARLNREGRGDQVMFYLRRPADVSQMVTADPLSINSPAH
ncbi:MAG: class I SAM-dependent methyltransferase [Acidobacteria bacterium]|nr:class I SAM-dependent methyltransferase [Acidobacteriota bacterium]